MKKERDVNLMRQSNMKKRLLALATTVLTLVMCMVTAMPALAADTNVAPTDNLTTTFNKYLVMDEKANVPDVDFTFTITAGSAVEADGSRVIYAGNDTRVTGFPVLKVDGAGTATTVATSFNPGDATYTEKQGSDTVSLGSGQKYAKETVTVDFTNVDFNAPGIYRYVITETGNAQDGIHNDTTATRTLDVIVNYRDANAGGQLVVSNYILYQGTKTDATNESTKDDGFTNTYATSNLTLEKQVTGNQGDRDKYFEFTVNITDAVAGTVYSVDLTDATWNSTSSPNPTELTVGESGAVSGTFYLKDDESIVIQGLTEDTSYTIAETSYANDGYKTEYKIDSEDSVEANTTTAKTMGTSDHKVTFTNDKSGTVPTGILLETAPYVVLMLVVVAGGVALLAAKRKHSR